MLNMKVKEWWLGDSIFEIEREVMVRQWFSCDSLFCFVELEELGNRLIQEELNERAKRSGSIFLMAWRNRSPQQIMK